MTELKISIPKEIADKIKEHPEINWEDIISGIIEKYISDLETNANDIKNEDLMKLTEDSLKKFLEDEPELYTDKDLKVKYQYI